MSLLWTREFHLDLGPSIRFTNEHPEKVIIWVGALLRLIVYLINRSMWLDELSLAGNIIGKPIFGFSQNLANDQLAPFGFLVVQRGLVHLFGDSNFVMRFVPLVAGMLSLYLFSRLVARVLPRRAGLIALVLFAFSDDLIYYSSEMKPYSVDIAVGLLISLTSLDVLGRSASIRSVLMMSCLAAAAPWWSFPSAFVVAGCGATLVLESMLAGRIRTATVWMIVGLGWLLIFYMSYISSRALLSPYTTMYHFWDFAFIPNQTTLARELPMEIIRSDLIKAAGILLEILTNPLNLVVPIWPRVGVFLPLVLLQIGEVVMARRSWSIYLILFSPIVMAMIAAGYKKYPLHGRLVLELVPAIFVLIAEGTEWVALRDRTRSRYLYRAVLILLLAYPCLTAFYYATGRRDRLFNSHGDLHANLYID